MNFSYCVISLSISFCLSLSTVCMPAIHESLTHLRGLQTFKQDSDMKCICTGHSHCTSIAKMISMSTSACCSKPASLVHVSYKVGTKTVRPTVILCMLMLDIISQDLLIVCCYVAFRFKYKVNVQRKC